MCCRMAITLWSTKTPGAAQQDRDLAVMNNKKKVSDQSILCWAAGLNWSQCSNF